MKTMSEERTELEEKSEDELKTIARKVALVTVILALKAQQTRKADEAMRVYKRSLECGSAKIAGKS